LGDSDFGFTRTDYGPDSDASWQRCRK
jgi:hypothetical protein